MLMFPETIAEKWIMKNYLKDKEVHIWLWENGYVIMAENSDTMLRKGTVPSGAVFYSSFKLKSGFLFDGRYLFLGRSRQKIIPETSDVPFLKTDILYGAIHPAAISRILKLLGSITRIQFVPYRASRDITSLFANHRKIVISSIAINRPNEDEVKTVIVPDLTFPTALSLDIFNRLVIHDGNFAAYLDTEVITYPAYRGLYEIKNGRKIFYMGKLASWPAIILEQ